MILSAPDSHTCQGSPGLPPSLVAAWIALATAFIVWPFSWSGFSSQIVGACMLLPCLIKGQHWLDAIKAFWGLAWIPYLLLCCILLLHWVQGDEHPGLLLFLTYMFKIPALGVLVYGGTQTLKRSGFRSGAKMQIFWLAVLLPLLVMLFQLFIPSFNGWIIEQLGGFRVEQVISGNNHGHPFRFLGLNGFLFASHGVAFAFTALGMLVCRNNIRRPSVTYLFFCIELVCLLAALLSGRSALPLLGIYIIASLYFAHGLRQRLVMCLVYLVIGVLMALLPRVSEDGRQFITWLIEPVQTSLERGTLASASMDITLQSYQGLSNRKPQEVDQESFSFHGEDLLKSSSLVGEGVYFRNNAQYEERDLTSSDSGFVRLIYLAGYLGCTLFVLFWLALFVRAWQFSRYSPWLPRVYLALFTSYGLVFFVKSEWLYQNFFIFYFFLLFYYFDSAAKQNHAHYIRQGVSAAA